MPAPGETPVVKRQRRIRPSKPERYVMGVVTIVALLVCLRNPEGTGECKSVLESLIRILVRG